MNRYALLFFVGLASALTALAMPGAAPAGLHERAEVQGLPVRTVRWHGDRYEVVLEDGATPAQRAQAEALARTYLDEDPPAERVPVTVVDALALLHANPTLSERRAALKILEAHAEGLR